MCRRRTELYSKKKGGNLGAWAWRWNSRERLAKRCGRLDELALRAVKGKRGAAKCRIDISQRHVLSIDLFHLSRLFPTFFVGMVYLFSSPFLGQACLLPWVRILAFLGDIIGGFRARWRAFIVLVLHLARQPTDER
ncbi:hypothetical protein P280DRAFT_201211 [Massarina eburnea CBS 473.64]|uniref:Uncharacterized protein n=1 Tax=Massarina eburnea CBS 473.64 TaxID=1395130 RepID=A0A6A6RKL0_9PLEO|nr:hypothetical protein P280DRAFT_201211 [Massarina eburnea CBS 473.64]